MGASAEVIEVGLRRQAVDVRNWLRLAGMLEIISESQALSTPPILRIGTAVHPAEYCRSAPPINVPGHPVTLGLPCSPENEEVPNGEKDRTRRS